MANYNSIAKIVNTIPKFVGKTPTPKAFNKKEIGYLIDWMGASEPKLANTIRQQLAGAKEPFLEVLTMAKSNYNIGLFRLSDVVQGKKVLAQGAVSVSNLGTNQSVIKFHATAGNNVLGANRPLFSNSKGLAEGQSALVTGFIDAGKPTNAKDIAAAISKKQGMVTANAHIGENFGINAIVRENELVRMLRDIPMDASGKARLEKNLNQLAGIKDATIGFMRNGDKGTVNYDFKLAELLEQNGTKPKNIIEYFSSGSKNLQRSIDREMVDIRKALRGEPKAPAYKGPEPATAETFAKVSDAVKPLDLEKAFEAKTLACDEKILKVDKIGLKDFQAEMDAIKKKYEL